MRRICLLLLLGALVLSFATACTKKQQTEPGNQGRISATKAYEKYFGPAPTTDKGNCYAFVIYFTSAKHPGKIIPFPFFTFDEKTVKKVAVERLLGGMGVDGYAGEFLQPFPVGIRLLGITQEKDIITVNFNREVLFVKKDEVAGKAAVSAISSTLGQFAGVGKVRVQVEGTDVQDFLGYAVQTPITPAETAVIQPSPPRLLTVTAVKDKGAKNVDEVSAYFDRPVDVQEVIMSDRSGKPHAGDMYHSVFDMAAVLKPKDPTEFKERMPIKVKWKVTDKLGRHAEGDNVWLLEVREH